MILEGSLSEYTKKFHPSPSFPLNRWNLEVHLKFRRELGELLDIRQQPFNVVSISSALSAIVELWPSMISIYKCYFYSNSRTWVL